MRLAKRGKTLALGVTIVLFTLIILIAIFVVSLRVNRENIFKQTECALPCWYGIRPGESTETEFLEIVERYPRNFSSLERFENSDTTSYLWFDKDLRFHLRNFIENGRIRVIRINTRNQINLGQLFAALGEPTTYKVEIAGGDEGSFSANFNYDEIGLAFSRFDYPYDSNRVLGEGKCSLNLSAEFTVEEIYIFENAYPDLEPEILSGRESAIPWEGFQNARLAECLP